MGTRKTRSGLGRWGPSTGIDEAAVRALYQVHVRPATATAGIMGDLTLTFFASPVSQCTPTRLRAMKGIAFRSHELVGS
jgi:hypothetical protein